MLALREERAEPVLAESQIFVVDDDAMVRDSLVDLFGSVGLHAEAFASTRAFLDAPRRDVPSCLVLDVRMPEESGLDLQRRMNDQGLRIPIIFITGHADVPMSVRAMKLGATNFLPKPFRDQELLDAVGEALRQDAEQRAADAGTAELRKLAERLTPRELDVLKAVDRGLLNKQIAYELGIAEITVKMHRSSAFRKLKATTVADMIQKVRALNLR
ncbi:response regulator transcription factor [Sphingomonas sp. TDK1]|uniref:response regulator transcription factor n=1 Tax=Sphingomonas sp. TDK1 TaxID=453247 RepID=UPI0007D94180|nr:response regulator [Sphingomonas sp. TDK1]OAN66576.1 DNA-binding response regulator [Sphingomonas sp. TDK1]